MDYTRVICLTPSITETIFALGAGERVVGVTDACDYPSEANKKSHICSWFDPDINRLKALKPDLVLGLQTAHAPLAARLTDQQIHCQLVNPINIKDVLNDILHLGELLDTPVAAQTLVNSLLNRLEKLDVLVQEIAPSQRLTVSRVLDIEEEQLIIAGPQSFQYNVIARGGGINVSSSFDVAYPKVTFDQFQKWDPQMIFICGSDISYLSRLKSDPRWQSLQAIQGERIYQFDCGLTCRTGPRIVDMAELLFQTLYG